MSFHLVFHHCRQLLSLVNHLLHFYNGRNTVGQILHGVYLFQLLLQVLGYAMLQLLDRVNTAGLQQLSKLRAR